MEAKITIKEIRSALAVDVALGKISKETADHVIKCLGLDWKEEEYNKRKDIDCFFEDLKELFERYEASLYLKGNYEGEVWVKDFAYSFNFGSPVEFDKDFIALLPKMWKRVQKVRKLNIPETTHINDITPIFDAIRKVNTKCWNHVSEKKFDEMIKPYK